ncbi:2-polyprenyl-6-methoxyphenol hydroxylase-like FAD-dependent oxidoreductase [Sphingomonas jejuensis]|uniref:2-polyprenyl-6-methoxyphenol hydroxylase-like FAD-dependent oxidoreductase n=1 Tax=Sphingomonas jejuensis TaxID=904715 RepID=A0ABX0XJ20_9SPHN|nr:NAD(P)/FAD-dependent oxidoreductase [Sphingomonas jejuensis]NJC32806.1 2-polyprenyl-6-methoxyphenol hydroxylase-like FAD-dependent oxidoreductase [Sphingomonas jejuensis]
MGPVDIAVAGCGPGGLAAALLLHRDGHRVTLFERFDSPRPLGSGLMIQPTGLAVLDRLGLADRLLDHGARIERLFGQADGRTVLDVHYAALGHADAFGIGTHRASLFAVLHDACRAEGIPIRTGRTVRGSELASGGKRRLLFEDEARSEPFDLVVDMLGCRSRLAPPCVRELAYGALWASLDWPPGLFDGAALEQRYRRASVMAGVLPIGTPPHGPAPQAAFFWSLRADRLPAWRDRGLNVWKAEVAALWPATQALLDQIVDPQQLTFARYAHRTLPNPGGDALIHLGDAWHSASPQLGQGANMALLDAWALASALRGAAGVADAIARTVRSRRRHVRLYQWLTALFTPVYQSDSRLLPFARDRIVGPASRLWPATWIQAAMVSGLIGDPLAPLGLRARA